MSYIVGIDMGSSNTKGVLVKNGKLIDAINTPFSNNLNLISYCKEELIRRNNIKEEEIRSVALTGLGAVSLKLNPEDKKTVIVPELKSIGLGGKYLSGLDKTIVVNIGTGTALIKISGDEIIHLGGSGVGGGTLLGLSKLLLSKDSIEEIGELIDKGDISKIDLAIGDVCKIPLEGLPLDTTVSNFGQLSSEAKEEDIARGIINMIFQVIGMMAVFSAKADKISKVVLTGSLTKLKSGLFVFEDVGRLHNIEFIIPEQGEYATALGAVISIIEE